MQKISAGEVHFEPPFTSFNHLVGDCEEPSWQAEAGCLCGVEIDHELEFGRLHDRQVRRLRALEDAANIDTSQAISLGDACCVAHTTTRLGKVTQGIDRRHPVVSRQRSELNATVVEQRAGSYQKRINRLLRKAAKGRIDVTAGGGLDEDFDLLPDGQGRSLNVRDKGLCGGEVGIDQHANAYGSWLQLMQQSK